MGLIISVIVACVGVYKFVQIYCYRGEKIGYEPRTVTFVGAPPDGDINGAADQLFDRREQVEFEATSGVLKPDSRRFLVTENDRNSSSFRKFLVTEDDFKNPNLREFFVAKGTLKKNSGSDIIVLVDAKKDFDSDLLFPLPKQFIITQAESRDDFRNVKQGIVIDVNSLSFKGKEVENLSYFTGDIQTLLSAFPFVPKTRNTFKYKLNTSVVLDDCLEDTPSGTLGETEFHRDPSPYPSILVPRTLCSTSTSAITATEIEEEPNVEVVLVSHTFDKTEYWSNKVLVEPSKKYPSHGHSSKHGGSKPKNAPKSESCDHGSNDNHQERRISEVGEAQDENFKDSLDGIKRNGAFRSFRKRKNRSQNSLENDENVCEGLGSVEAGNQSAENTTLIFSGEYTKAMNKDWHGQHFCCWQCDESLTGQRYVLRDDHPYCVSCYESVFANACEKCSRTIGIDSKDLSYKDKHWHEACFLCTTCGESLVDKQFGSKGDRIYCGRCYDNQFASRCDGCNEIFRAGTKKMEYKTRQWHEKCFCCCVCKVPIGTQSFIPREQEIYCAKCYEEKFATRCIKCNKVITSGGVTYKNEPWHRECFTCTHCSKSLAGERFTSRDEKPYCAECFGELFAKRCFACNKPITGIGGTKFISFEDRHWHNDCFFCASCRNSLVGRGFITDQDDIICPECAKQKLL